MLRCALYQHVYVGPCSSPADMFTAKQHIRHTPVFQPRGACCSDLAQAHGQRFLLPLRQHPSKMCTASPTMGNARAREGWQIDVQRGGREGTRQFAPTRGSWVSGLKYHLQQPNSAVGMSGSATPRGARRNGDSMRGWRSATKRKGEG